MIGVTFVISGLSTGGAEIMLVQLLKKLDRSRFAPHVISLTNHGPIGAQIEALGIPVEALELRAGLSGMARIARLVRRLRDLRPHVVHTWMYHADLIGGLAARLAGVRSVAWGLHNSNLDPARTKRATRLVVRACAAISGWTPHSILSCSERAKQVHAAIGYPEAKIVVIPNGFDIAVFRHNMEARASVRAELGIESDALLVGHFARNDPLKNHIGFVQAMQLIHERLPNARFVLAGAGIDSDNAELTARIDAAALRDAVRLLGRREDMPRLMASLDVFCSSSHGEAFPLVVGEAMACEVPCVVTDAGDSAEIVGATGRVVPVGDMAGLARETVSLLSLSESARLELGQKARARVIEKFEIGRIVQRYEAFYSSLIGASACAA
jgi:glycosyltransferase involved in cell wall biosynthesis